MKFGTDARRGGEQRDVTTNLVGSVGFSRGATAGGTGVSCGRGCTLGEGATAGAGRTLGEGTAVGGTGEFSVGSAARCSSMSLSTYASFVLSKIDVSALI